MTATVWCEHAWLPAGIADGVRIGVDAGRIASVRPGTEPRPDDERRHGVTFAGIANAHSHLFHRFLRGRTHGGRGDFWTWREQMYALAGQLDPDNYYLLARAVFSEMLAAGYTSVGEFHYVHHRPGGRPYPHHDMEMAIAAAARETGIRLTLLDTCYLSGGIDAPLSAEQTRFGDGDGAGWLARWESLREALRDAGDEPNIRLGAAVHSVRAVPRPDLEFVAAHLPADVPLHIHLSEQPAENDGCRRAYGTTPTGVLEGSGLLQRAADRPLTVVHATHLTDADVVTLGAAGVVVAMCPSTEADLADGVGPARALADAGARIALGSDQNAVIDPLLEARGLEAGERLASGERGRFSVSELTAALTSSGHASLGWDGGSLEPGKLADLVSVDAASVRTLGSDPEQLALSATADDVHAVMVGGRTVRTDPAAAIRAALDSIRPNAYNA
ncbi:formimidoylglutamate deiminase [Spelaeicoccus albus]|uniref:Formiminoglutamate deiminase n=1 Tax=Spelaeicoccus albus TaxID=1280376 RepID=A0A7Z0D544_9MICO|nr:formimidoylglutamate deiminase [Spelaeicoccus albus]NYI69056.1 formiminoglutamate deiminase [Spelaeicoccus albus]